MLPWRVEEAGLMGGLSEGFVRPRPSYAPPYGVVPFVEAGWEFSDAWFTVGKGAGARSSMGESGGGGMPVPSVRE